MNVPTIPTLKTVDLLAVKITKFPDGDENEFEDGDVKGIRGEMIRQTKVLFCASRLAGSDFIKQQEGPQYFVQRWSVAPKRCSVLRSW
jgi:hypothetical protein